MEPAPGTPAAAPTAAASSKPASGPRLRELDALRGLAAFTVVLFHYTTHYQTLYGHAASFWPRFGFGKYGVNLFFMISGFVILMTLEKSRSWKDFVVSRFSRLYPAYWCAVAVTFVIVSLERLPDWRGSPKVALVNLTMLQLWLKVPHIDGVYWTLSLELSFYAIMLGLSLIGLLRRLEIIGLIWMGLELADYYYTKAGGHVMFLVEVTFILYFAHLFIAGMMFYRWKKDGFTVMRGAIIVLALGVHALIGEEGSMIPTVVAFAVFLLFALDRLSFILVKPILFLGAISYSLYLLHANIGYVIIRAGYARGVSPWISVLVALGVSLALASLQTFFIERPALEAIRGRMRGRRNQPPPKPARA